MKRALTLLLGVSLLASCLLVETRHARDSYIASGYERLVKEATWTLGSVVVEKGVGPGSLEDEARSILRVILSGFPGPDGGSSADSPLHSRRGLTLTATIREREFVRDYRSLNAVSVEMCLYDTDPGIPVAIALYSASSPDTIESPAYLYNVISRTLRAIRR